MTKLERFIRRLFNQPEKVWKYDCPDHEWLSDEESCPTCNEIEL